MGLVRLMEAFVSDVPVEERRSVATVLGLLFCAFWLFASFLLMCFLHIFESNQPFANCALGTGIFLILSASF